MQRMHALNILSHSVKETEQVFGYSHPSTLIYSFEISIKGLREIMQTVTYFTQTLNT